MRSLRYTGANVFHSVLDVYLLSLIDRGQSTKYELQRLGGVSLGSSTPALKRLQKDGLITQRDAEDGTNRVRQILEITSAGRRIARQGWRQFFDAEASLDLKSILRLVDIARAEGAPLRQTTEFLNRMASRRQRPVAKGEISVANGITGLQQGLTAYRANAESAFLRQLAKSLRRSRKPSPSTNPARTKMRPSS